MAYTVRSACKSGPSQRSTAPSNGKPENICTACWEREAELLFGLLFLSCGAACVVLNHLTL
eukprot:3389490-Amphidinium_carterae.1